MRLIISCKAATIAAVIACAASSIGSTAAAAAACRDDLIKADQDFSKSRSALQAAASAAPPAKCAAYRRHVAALTQVGKVLARCDTGGDKAKNATQTNAALADFKRQMTDACKK